MPNNSDALWARFVFQGPFGSRATGLGTGKAAGIWKTPAAYFGRRPGVSGPERAAFIRELEEGKPGSGPIGSRRPAPSGIQCHSSTTPAISLRHLSGHPFPISSSAFVPWFVPVSQVLGPAR